MLHLSNPELPLFISIKLPKRLFVIMVQLRLSRDMADFLNTLCTSVNDEVVHGIPSDYVLKEGDIISVDCGVILNGWYGDSAYTFPVGEIS